MVRVEAVTVMRILRVTRFVVVRLALVVVVTGQGIRSVGTDTAAGVMSGEGA